MHNLPSLQEGDVVRMKSFQLGDRVWKKDTVTARLGEDHTKVKHLTGKLQKKLFLSKEDQRDANIRVDVHGITSFQGSEHATQIKPPQEGM